MKPRSITRRLILTVLLMEAMAALVLIAATVIHEREIELESFDADLRGSANTMLGAVQDAEDADDNVMLDLRGLRLAPNVIYRVVDDRGRTLGESGAVPSIPIPDGEAARFRNVRIDHREYRFYLFRGTRIIDPGKDGGVRHELALLYGAPVGHVWHEVVESVRFFAIATVILLGGTAIVLVWLVRRELQPIRQLAEKAEEISSTARRFDAPAGAMRTRELRPLAVALEQALARLERAFQQQKRFTSDAAHELKTDVAIVKSSLQLLAMRRRNEEEYHQGLLLSLHDFTRLETTIAKMLTLARLEQPPEGDVTVCRFSEALEEAIHQSRPLAELKNITFHAEIGSGDSVAGDSVAIDRRDVVLLSSNLLINAVQHSEPGASVNIALATEGTSLRFTVADEGEGVPSADLPYLFDPFYRGDPSRSRKSGSTGLGLSICQAICHRAGGSIEIANRAEGGAVVTVCLPVAPVLSPAPSTLATKA